MSPAIARKQQFEDHKLAKRLRRQVGQAIADYQLIEDGDRVMVCLSGGKDSHTLLDLLLKLQARAPVAFELHAVHLDQKQPGYDPDVLPAWLRSIGVPYTDEDIAGAAAAVEGKSELDALIAYLQSLGTNLKAGT